MDTLPRELIILIFNYLEFDDLVIHIFTSKRYKNITENIIKNIKISKYRIHCNKQIKILFTFKPCIEKLHIFDLYDGIFTNLGLSEINYKILYLHSINLWYVEGLNQLDSKISEKCEKICFINCCHYFKSLITSMKILKKCKSIEFGNAINSLGSEFGNDILEILDTLPELTISFYYCNLTRDCMTLLADHKRVLLVK